VVELRGDLPDPATLSAPVQQVGVDEIAFWVSDVPPVGYAAPSSGVASIAHPAAAAQERQTVTLQNGLVAVTLDGARGSTFASMRLVDGPELLRAPGDDVVYFDDNGDVYGARFGAERARASRVPARITILATGPLVARAQAVFTLGGQPITKTVTLYADSPRIDVDLQLAALPDTSAIVQMPTPATRTRAPMIWASPR
jgi:Glycosyl hydrolases family 38 C-terminal domain